jgi:hypothetical protein
LKKSLLASLLVSVGLLASAAAVAQTPAKVVPLEADAMVITATVQSVDLKTRVVTLKDASGNLAQMGVAKDVKDLEKVKKGDVFVVEHAEAMAVGLALAPKGMPANVSGTRTVTVAGKGAAKPFEIITDTINVAVKITAIDAKSRKVTFTLPSGEKQTVKVAPAVLGLEKFKVGDDVVVEFADETIIGFVTPKKK